MDNLTPKSTAGQRAILKQQEIADQKRRELLKSDETDFVIPGQYIVNASKMKGLEDKLENLIRYGR